MIGRENLDVIVTQANTECSVSPDCSQTNYSTSADLFNGASSSALEALGTIIKPLSGEVRVEPPQVFMFASASGLCIEIAVREAAVDVNTRQSMTLVVVTLILLQEDADALQVILVFAEVHRGYISLDSLVNSDGSGDGGRVRVSGAQEE